MLRAVGPEPANVSGVLLTGDSVMFRHVDSEDNLTLQVRMDGDGDGAYNNLSVDWDSGLLTKSCELDADGNKTDSECEVIFIVPFNESSSFGSGVYRYEVLSSVGGIFQGCIEVEEESHADATESGHGEHSSDDHAEHQEHQSDSCAQLIISNLSDDKNNDSGPTIATPLSAIGGAQTLLVLSALSALIGLAVMSRISTPLNDEIRLEKEKQDVSK